MSVFFQRTSFSNGNAQIAAFSGDGLTCPVAPIERVLLYRVDNLGSQEAVLPNNIGLALQPLSIFFQFTGTNPSVTFSIKRTSPTTEIIMSFTVTQPGFSFPICAISPDYVTTVQCSSNVSRVSLFCKPVDIIDIIPIVS